MAKLDYDPAFACRPEPHIVVTRWSSIHCEARLAGEGLAGGEPGIGTNPEEAIANLIKLDPRAKGLESEVRDADNVIE